MFLATRTAGVSPFDFPVEELAIIATEVATWAGAGIGSNVEDAREPDLGRNEHSQRLQSVTRRRLDDSTLGKTQAEPVRAHLDSSTNTLMFLPWTRSLYRA